MKRILVGLCLVCSVYASDDGRINGVIEKLSQGKPVFGIFSGDRSLNNAGALADSNLDFVVIELEHNPMDFEAVRVFLQGMLSRREVFEGKSLRPRVVPFLRIPANGSERLQFLTKQALDLGIYGLMLPSINNASEALAAVRAARYPQKLGAVDVQPPGLRGVSAAKAARYWGLPTEQYMERADIWPLDPKGELFLMLQIETPEGVANVESILTVPGVSSIFIGPDDLSTSLGYAGDSSVSAVQQAIAAVLKACRAKGIPCGIAARPSDIERYIQQGFQFFTLGGDGGMSVGAAEALARARK